MTRPKWWPENPYEPGSVDWEAWSEGAEAMAKALVKHIEYFTVQLRREVGLEEESGTT